MPNPIDKLTDHELASMGVSRTKEIKMNPTIPALVPVALEAVNHPKHYNQGKIEAIEFIEDQEFNFNVGNTVKYLCRYRFKGTPIQDLEKALWYLQRELNRMKKNVDGGI